MKMQPYARKGDVQRCSACGDAVCEFAKEVFFNDLIVIEMFEKKYQAARWGQGSRLCCEKCGYQINFHGIGPSTPAEKRD